MVHPYLRRREARKTSSIQAELEKVLGKTLAFPCSKSRRCVLRSNAPDSPLLRRSASAVDGTFKHTGGSQVPRQTHFRHGRQGYELKFAEKTFAQLEGFGSYAFPKARRLIRAARLRVVMAQRHHPDVFCAALLNAQPMGFLRAAQIVRDARNHNVEARPSASTLALGLHAGAGGDEDLFAVRLGLAW